MGRLPRIALRIVLTALAAVTMLWAVASLSWPFGFDQGAFAWVGDVILRGGVPYRDAFDVKGPMSFLPSAAVMAVAGRNWWGIRLFDLLLVLGMALTIARLASRYSNRSTGIAAALLWVTAYANSGFANTAQPDGWVIWGLLFALAPACISDAPVHRRYPVMAGVVVALAAMLKPFYVVFLCIPMILAWRDPRFGAQRKSSLGLVLAAFLVPIGVMLAWLGSHRALPAFWEAYVRFNTEKNSQSVASAVSGSLSYGLLADPFVLLALPLSVAGLVALHRRNQRAALVLGCWLAFALPITIIQRPYYPYRLHILSPVIAILAAAALALPAPVPGQDPSARRVPAALGGALLLLAALTFGRHPLGEGLRWVRLASGHLPASAYYARYPVWHATAADERAAARYLVASSTPNTRVFSWNHPSVAVLAGRPLVPRLSIQTPVQAELPASVRQRYLDELAATLTRTPPGIVVTEDTLGRRGACLACLPPFAALGSRGETLAAPFHLIFQSGTLVMYRRD